MGGVLIYIRTYCVLNNVPVNSGNLYTAEKKNIYSVKNVAIIIPLTIVSAHMHA